jgi:hypothetical protein
VQPLRVYAKDFDANESIDAILSCYFKSEEGDMREYPAHFWDELNGQSPKFRNQFSSYKQYGLASIEKLLKPYDTTGILVLKANYSQSSFVQNEGNGKFLLKPLPKMAQVSPVNGITTDDVNGDGNLDVFMIGNDYGNEVFSGRYDACTGLVLLGNGNGEFKVSPSYQNGFKVDGDAKALARLKSALGKELLIATQNLDSLCIFIGGNDSVNQHFFHPAPYDSWAVLEHKNTKKEKVEFYYGSGYLSQSTRSIVIPQSVTGVVVYDYKGNARSIKFNQLAYTSGRNKSNVRRSK